MKCLSCNRDFIIKRTIKNLFTYHKLLICDKCYKSHSLNIETNVIPLNNNHRGIVISLLSINEKMNHNAYLLEYSKIVDNFKNRYLLLFDNFKANSYNIKTLNIIEELIDDDIYIICYRFNI